MSRQPKHGVRTTTGVQQEIIFQTPAPSFEQAVVDLRAILERFNAAELSGDQAETEIAYQAAEDLAVAMNGGEYCGIKAGPDSSGERLAAATAASAGQVPIWGQRGAFEIDVPCRTLIEMDGIYGLGFSWFSANAVDWTAPFISETGYRSFHGYAFDFAGGGISVEQHARSVVGNYAAKALKRGQLVAIAEQYRRRRAA